jgi:potassium-dependent mechanosensitive channel
MAFVRIWVVLAAFVFWLPAAVLAQSGTNFAGEVTPALATGTTGTLDYAAWDTTAKAAEDKIGDPQTTAIQLEQLRSEIASWRQRFLDAQGTNSTRINTLRTQIEALGAAPAEGETETPELAARRKELNEQLTLLQAPSISAVEAYSLADGLIREIDRVLRERQADEFLRLSPSPVNPANWPAAASVVTKMFADLAEEMGYNWGDEAKRRNLLDSLPVILGLILFALAMILRGRPLVEGVVLKIQRKASIRGQEVWAFLTSLGQIIVPMLGVWAVATALRLSGMLGPLGDVVAQTLIPAGFSFFAARWLGEQVFPKLSDARSLLRLSDDGRAEGRFEAWMLGLLVGLEALRGVLLPNANMSEAAASVLSSPTILLASVLLFRLGQLLRHHVAATRNDAEVSGFSTRLISIIGQGAMGVAVLAPILAAIGYVAAASGLVFPTVVSLGLFGLLFILQRLVGALYALITRNEEKGRDALVPVLVGFCLSLSAIPVFALIWGARVSDITEVMNRFREGFQLGSTRIAPTDFLLLAFVFGLGFLFTRLFQGALKTSILPKTSLDQGGQNAIVAGIGYVGIFLSGLVGINAAGIDLSGLAIVAGALSVGIGFGLQNIVSNFVSGIILLIERPVSEGDWIEVGGVQGTVRAISVRSTRIQTFDRTDVIVPNSDLVSGMVTNWTRFNLAGRLIVKVGVAYGTDTRKVAAILQEIAEAQPLAVLNPPPMVVLANFGADSLDFEIRVILRDVNFSMAVRSEINHEIARRFAEEGIEIPFGQRDIWIRNPEALQALGGAGAGASKPSGPASDTDKGPSS